MTAYEMICKEANGFLKEYKSDLYNHDKKVLEQVEGDFVWFLRSNGTWIFTKDRNIGLIPSVDHIEINLTHIKEPTNVKVFHGVNIPGRYALVKITAEEGVAFFKEWSVEWTKAKKVYQVFNADGTLRGESSNKDTVWKIVGSQWGPYEVREKESGNVVAEYVPF